MLQFVKAPGVLALVHGGEGALPDLGEELRHVVAREGGVEAVLLAGHHVGQAHTGGELAGAVQQRVQERHSPGHQRLPQG